MKGEGKGQKNVENVSMEKRHTHSTTLMNDKSGLKSKRNVTLYSPKTSTLSCSFSSIIFAWSRHLLKTVCQYLFGDIRLFLLQLCQDIDREFGSRCTVRIYGRKDDEELTGRGRGRDIPSICFPYSSMEDIKVQVWNV